MAYRVIQWYTGTIARQQIRIIQENPELELVGAVVHHANKSGKDVGELIGTDSIGITTVASLEEALKLDADVVLYNAPIERYDEILQILAAGMNVITPSAAFYPKNRPEHDDLQAACEKGQATLLGTGANPGFAGDVLPLVTSSLCARVRSVHVQEIGDLSGWDPFMLTEVMRFGAVVEDLEKDSTYFDIMTNSFQQSCQLLAEGLGFEVEEVTTQSYFARAKTDLLEGKVKAGTVGGIHLQVTVISKGKAVVTEDLMWLLSENLDPPWSIDPDAGEWQITIEGDPTVKVNASLSGGRSRIGPGVMATAARMVNSIHDVCSAAPGLLTAANAPMPRCRNIPDQN